MANQESRKVMDAVDINTGEAVYFASHAQATYMADGTTVENNIKDIKSNYATKLYVEDLISQYITQYITNVLNTPI